MIDIAKEKRSGHEYMLMKMKRIISEKELQRRSLDHNKKNETNKNSTNQPLSKLDMKRKFFNLGLAVDDVKLLLDDTTTVKKEKVNIEELRAFVAKIENWQARIHRESLVNLCVDYLQQVHKLDIQKALSIEKEYPPFLIDVKNFSLKSPMEMQKYLYLDLFFQLIALLEKRQTSTVEEIIDNLREFMVIRSLPFDNKLPARHLYKIINLYNDYLSNFSTEKENCSGGIKVIDWRKLHTLRNMGEMKIYVVGK